MRFSRREDAPPRRSRATRSRSSLNTTKLHLENLESRRLLALVGNWLFSEGSGTTTADSSGNGNTGTLVNAPTWITTGPTGHGNALQFDGNTQSVEIGDPSVLQFGGDITISAWVYNTTTTMSSDGVRYIVSHGSNSQYVFLRTWGGSYEFGNWNGAADDSVFAPIDQLDLNNWVLLTGVYSSSAGTWTIYRNGASLASVADPNKGTASGGALAFTGGDWRIGDSTPYSGVFSGNIDDVGIYNSALSATQVAALFPSGTTAPTVTVTKNSNTQVTVSWNRSTNANVTAYNVYRTTLTGQETGPPINATPIPKPSSGTTVSFVDTTVDLSVPGRAYFYKVVALDGNIAAKLSTEKSISTPLASTEGGTFTKLTSNKPIQEFVLLTDGTVLGQEPGNSASTWMKLTPSSTGSYTAGTWTQVASSSTIRDYMATSVMRDGRVIIAGGEYNNNGAFDATLSQGVEVYDPATNTWSTILDSNSPATAIQGTSFYDSESKLLPNGDVLFGAVSPSPGGTAEVYHVATNTWQATGPYAYGYGSPDELTWLALPDGSILMTDYDNTSQRYIPATNKWIADGNMPVPLVFGGEMGPGFMLPNGNAVFFGSTGNTLIYHPSGSSSPGTWTVGAPIPYGLATSDVPGDILPDGKIIMAIGAPAASGVPNGFRFVAYDYTTDSFQDVAFSLSGVSPPEIMLNLPNGNVLMSDLGTVYQFTPTNGLANAAWAPAITRLVSNGDGSWNITGTQLNGISSGASMGDDFQMDTNYPIVQLTATDGSGKVYYAKTTNWTNTLIQAGATPTSAKFTLPAGLPAGTYSLRTIANGISSAPVTFDNVPLTISSTTPAANATVTTSPTSYVVQFSAAIDPTTLQAVDLTVNGISATGVALSADAKTATFTFSTNPITAPGTQTVAMAVGAVSEQLDSAVQSPALSYTFTLSATALSITGTTPAANGAFTLPGPFTYDVTFNQAIDPAMITTSTLHIAGIAGASVTNAVMVSGNTTARFTISGITSEGTLTLSIPGNTVYSPAGLPLSAFSANYGVDIPTTALSASPQLPLGSLVYSGSFSGLITAADSDAFSLSLNANQNFSVVVTPTGSATLRPSVLVLSPSAAIIAVNTPASAGQAAVVQSVSTTGAAGTYTISVSGATSTVGSYTVQVYLNSSVENEGVVAGATNNTMATSQSLNSTNVSLGNGGQRVAVLGKADGAATADYYSFSVGSNAGISVALLALTGGNLSVDLLNSSGTVLASGVGGFTNLSKTVPLYTTSAAGSYYLRVNGDAGSTYSLIMTQNGTFEGEPNDGFASPQNIDLMPGVLGNVKPNDDDWFSLSVNSAYQLLKFTTSTPLSGAALFGNALTPTLQLYSPAGDLLTSGSLLPDGRNQTLQYDAIATGIYRIHVAAASGTQGEYYLTSAMTPAASVQSVTIDNGAIQRSLVRSITITFGGTIATAPSAAFSVTRVGDNLSIPVTASAVTVGGGTSQVTLTFSGGALINGSLPDGNYTLSIDGSQILDSLGQQLDAAGSGLPGSVGTTSFFRLYGDANGDRIVNSADITIVASNYLTPGALGDVDGDGVINSADITIIASNYLSSIPAPPSASFGTSSSAALPSAASGANTTAAASQDSAAAAIAGDGSSTNVPNSATEPVLAPWLISAPIAAAAPPVVDTRPSAPTSAASASNNGVGSGVAVTSSYGMVGMLIPTNATLAPSLAPASLAPPNLVPAVTHSTTVVPSSTASSTVSSTPVAVPFHSAGAALFGPNASSSGQHASSAAATPATSTTPFQHNTLVEMLEDLTPSPPFEPSLSIAQDTQLFDPNADDTSADVVTSTAGSTGTSNSSIASLVSAATGDSFFQTGDFSDFEALSARARAKRIFV